MHRGHSQKYDGETRSAIDPITLRPADAIPLDPSCAHAFHAVARGDDVLPGRAPIPRPQGSQ